MFANTGPFATAEGATALARAAEDAGFESVWTVEHVLVPKDYESEYPYARSGRMPGSVDAPIPDPLIWLTWVAAQTTRIRLATGILILPQRNPAITAKEVATLDRLSGGRVILGVGAGWLEEEFRALDVPFEKRGLRLDDYIAAMRELWTEDEVDHDSEFVQWSKVISRPQPEASVPIVIGGHTEVAARRAGRLGDGFFPGRGSPATLASLIGVMRGAADAAGRDADTIEVTTGGSAAFAPDPLEALAELEALGVHRVVIPPLSYDPATIADVLGTFGEDVIAKAR